MNFNNPDDVFSSSPLSGDNASPGGAGDSESDMDEDDATAKIDSSLDSNDSGDSSARLDEALRQAAAQAGTQKLDMDENGDMTMELAEDDITASFKPWAKKSSTFEGQENVDPFSPVAPRDSLDDEDDADEMSMDITRAMGRIVPQSQSPGSDMDDMSMDLTMALGSIQQTGSKEPATRRKSLKRRVSVLEPSQGSPAKRPASRRTSLRTRSKPEESSPADDATMDFTVAIGGIKSNSQPTNRQEPERRASVDTSFGDETMDFTVAVGSIKGAGASSAAAQNSNAGAEEDEDMSMEFTNVIGGIKNLNKPSTPPEKSTVAQNTTPTAKKTPTPSRSSAKSTGRPKASQPSPSPRKALQITPKKSPGRPRKSLATTPEIPPPSVQIERFEPSPFVRSTPQSAKKLQEPVSTPTGRTKQIPPPEIPDDPIAAPILNRRRSSLSLVQFSPLAAAREETTLQRTALLSNNIKLLSTPRKQTLASPMKRGMTPKKAQTPQKEATPKQKTPTPKKATPRKSLSPKKRVAFGAEPEVQADEDNEDDAELQEDDVERISLQEFLDMTKIRFMDLSTTKRRHTAAPASFHDREIEPVEESLDRFVVAGSCTLPEYELYQHACHEMKKYISDGRDFVRTMESNVMEENPLLFTEYLTAPPDQRIVMDNQFKNLKTSARLEARGEWYGWRRTLLGDLKTGLLNTMQGFIRDEAVLVEREKILDAVLPSLTEQHDRLSSECQQLQQRHDELNSCDREELEQAREQLVAADSEIEERKQLLAQLQQELAEKEERIEAVKERKIECVAEIKAAERVREECRGWSTSEVNDLKGMLPLQQPVIWRTYANTAPAKVTALEEAHGWSITSASSTTITMTHAHDLELYFQPSAFATGSDSPNASISLAYVGDSATPHPRPLTTCKRFFLQLIRAHLHCIPQSQTRIADLLSLVKNSWATALAVAEGVRWLEHSYITDEHILSDERIAISTNMLLPSLQTKVRCTFEVGASMGENGVETVVEPKAELVYGEKYKADRMRDFLKDFCGDTIREESEMAIWADAVVDLADKLKATGRKGERA
jgi:kinetochore protein Spc7/SPC105